MKSLFSFAVAERPVFLSQMLGCEQAGKMEEETEFIRRHAAGVAGKLSECKAGRGYHPESTAEAVKHALRRKSSSPKASVADSTGEEASPTDST